MDGTDRYLTAEEDKGAHVYARPKEPGFNRQT
jgi:hypothetical protein